ncbi:PQQ-dependent sugar dehydrogenase [Gloeocapsopsis dulcis]|uniref:PQQ-dependent sugar dehydrogenase n=1 Tax=Gloeocapsopsis dulcis TaxID=2859516 RepID=UPI00101AEA0D|nr:PQQ-dependent sugar dehydrogenase [Gloeocapsopsis dulcis]WNN89062.1 PQQ-dependent sugar dehydrogenase [Gloeocapsopsis dulcis]
MPIRLKQLPILSFALILGATCAVPVIANETNSDENLRAANTSQTYREVATEDTQYQGIRVVEIASGMEHPWAVAFLPDGRFLVTERPGRLNIVENGKVIEVSGIPKVNAENQGGLLDIALHPNYATNGWIYMTYSKPNGNGQTATALARGQLKGNTLVDVQDVFVQNRYSEPGQHYGSRLAWTNDGKLLMTIGDRWFEPLRAQNLRDHAGSVLRLNDNGSVPKDNPFVGNPDVADEIYTYGNRNIQSLVVNRTTGDIWAVDHGPRGGDLLYQIAAGNNYGWPRVTRGLDYDTENPIPESVARRMEGVVEPFYEFLPTHAPSGVTLVTANRFPSWRGNLLVGGLASRRIRRVVFNKQEVVHEEELLLQTVGRIRDVREGPDGYLYVLTDESKGGLYRIEPADLNDDDDEEDIDSV